MENKFNDVREFEKDLTDILLPMIERELKETLNCLIETHNLKPLIEILKIIKDNKYQENNKVEKSPLNVHVRLLSLALRLKKGTKN